MLALWAPSCGNAGHFNAFRAPEAGLAAEWAAYRLRPGADELRNDALAHELAVAGFCRRRPAGCSWEEAHALVDASVAPFKTMFDARRLRLSKPFPRPKRTHCPRVHEPTPADLLKLVRASQPAVLTGTMSGWAAPRVWSNDYFAARLGDRPVAVSVSDGAFDSPEKPEAWGLPPRGAAPPRDGRADYVVARPAHRTSTLTDAVADFSRASADGVRAYLEYFPMEALSAGEMAADLGAGAAGVAAADSRAAAREAWTERETAATGGYEADGAPPPAGASTEPGAPRVARWLMPRKHLLWMSGGGTVAATHYDPYENLMQVMAGSKTFHLAHPDDGPALGGFLPMAEGKLTFAAGGRLSRERAEVGPVTSLHHYAAARLSSPAASQPNLPSLPNATRITCHVAAGEVLYTPAYWWHEVWSHGDAARGGSSIGVNWFYESYYQRILPNESWDRSPHYALIDEATVTRDRPFPAHARPAGQEREAAADEPAGAARRARAETAGGGQAGTRRGSFADRLAQRRGGQAAARDREEL